MLEHGYRFDGSAVTGGQREVELDLFLVPDPATLVTYGESSGLGRRGRFSCSVRRRDGQPFAGDPRSVLERNLAEAREMGSTTGSPSSWSTTSSRRIRLACCRLPMGRATSAQAPGWARAPATTSSPPSPEMGIRVGGAHHETGPGQQELDLLTGDALRMADTVLTVREVIRAVAERHGLRANFMPKPLADAPGSGMHIFQRLYRLATADALRGEGESISLEARYVIAGQLAHARAMCAIACPTVNSYKRLAAGDAAFGYAYEGYERSIDTHISNLRKKIEPDPANPRYILTVYGMGYRFGG